MGIREFLDAANEQLNTETDVRIEAIRDSLESLFLITFDCGHSRFTKHRYTAADMENGWMGYPGMCDTCKKGATITEVKPRPKPRKGIGQPSHAHVRARSKF
jgi:hypothetical protein